MAGAIGAGPGEEAPIGTCAECDEPTTSLSPHPDDDGPIEEMRMVCSDCADDLAE